MKKRYYILMIGISLMLVGCQKEVAQEEVNATTPLVAETVEVDTSDIEMPEEKERVLIDLESEDLQVLQEKLRKLNYKLDVDGNYDESTQNVIKEIQSSELFVDNDGKLDEKTLDFIEGEYAERNVSNPDSLDVLVNKKYFLDENYEPKDLVIPSVPFAIGEMKMRKEASEALEGLFKKASEEGITLIARSGYRSYKTQVQLFNRYVKNHGYDEAVKFSAKPGQSEHQTGLAMDITADSVKRQLKYSFGDTVEGIWTADNCHKFGFIVRYPKDKTDITGYNYEPWHLRYLGVDLATKVYESGLTYEEYLGK
ncbi:MAG: D-alanyl-D-alanine carboxypeptidase family protein [Tissierellales bacterium]|jgi:D-alanyl-D-alanine carboxypeptidase|nr:D-alanyl-D-alanine carboxypeptidase family protein [Tissierellales bacterium]